MNKISIKIQEYREIIYNLIKLSLPILGGNLSQILVNFADTVVAGRYSTLALGAVSVASAIMMTIIIAGIGLVLSISPVIANLRGQKTPSKKYFKLTILFSIIVSIPFFIIVEFVASKIHLIGFETAMIEPMRQYIEICSWTIFPTILFTALKEFLQAYEKVVFANTLMLLMVILNVILNIILTFGFDFGFCTIPEMGVLGLSIATLISKTLVAIFMVLYCLPLFKTPFEKSKKYIKDLIKTGAPISAAIFFEFLGFNLTAVLIGKFSALFAGVHNIVLCIANMTFMIVLSVSNAISIKVGYYNGKKDKENIIKYSIGAISLALFICTITFIILSLYSTNIISIFTTDKEVIYWSEKIMVIVMAFLFFDGIQNISVGILKGFKDTKIIMYTMLLAYLLIAIPIGLYFAYCKNIVLEGFWTGLAIALATAAIITSTRVILNIKKIKNIKKN